MYNGIGLTTVRGSGTSGYVQTNKFNLQRRPPTNFEKQGDRAQLTGPTQNKANEAIIEHNRKREIERKLLEVEDELVDKGFGAEEVAERLAAKREELLLAADKEDAKERTVETHELAKRKADKMEQIRSAMGIATDAKEGQAFDRDLQERLKEERAAEREARQRGKEKEEKQHAKALIKREKQRKKDEKAKAKAAKKEAAAKKQEEERNEAERAKQETERARRAAEAKERRQQDLQARLGPRVDSVQPSREHRSSRDATHRSSRRDSLAERPPASLPDPAERYIPRGPEEDAQADAFVASSSPEAEAVVMQPPTSQPTQHSSLSPTPVPHRSRTPSPSPLKAGADKKRPPPARAPSPERSGPRFSPPPRKRNRHNSSSISPEPPTFRDGIPPSDAQRRGTHRGPGTSRAPQVGEPVPESRPRREEARARSDGRRDSGREREYDRRDRGRDIERGDRGDRDRHERQPRSEHYGRERRDRDEGPSKRSRQRSPSPPARNGTRRPSSRAEPAGERRAATPSGSSSSDSGSSSSSGTSSDSSSTNSSSSGSSSGTSSTSSDGSR